MKAGGALKIARSAVYGTTMRVSRTRASGQGLGQPPQRPHDINEKQEPAGAKRRSRFCRLQGNARRRDHSGGRVVVRHNTGSFEICFLVRRRAKRAKETKLRRVTNPMRSAKDALSEPVSSPRRRGDCRFLLFFFMMGNVGGFQAGKRNRRASAPFRFQTFRPPSSRTAGGGLQSPQTPSLGSEPSAPCGR